MTMDIDRMIDLSLELEGLLFLKSNRTDTPEQTDELIRRKVKSLAELASIACISDIPDNTAIAECGDDECPGGNNDSQGEEDELQGYGDESCEEEKVNESEEETEDSYVIEDEEDEIPVNPKQVKTVISDPCVEPEVTDVKVERTEESGRPRVSAPVFSVNDRFFFARELFDGNLQALDSALRDAASLDSVEEAEDYFCAQRGFDAENTVVQDFLAIISKLYV